jgi:uncharacterized protein YecT (DUF1311 family)
MEDGFGAEACVGLAAAGCMEATEGGQTTVGMGTCFVQELDWWQAGLDAVLAELMALHAATDAENAAAGMTVPNMVDALDAYHRAWLAYREAACTYEYAHWMGGTGGGPASAECHLQLTGAHMLALSGRLRDALIPEP